ncbi:zinc ribbon domain-containing protein [Vreelandella massiliensis]|uniref:zinc ribbon domain-containing protein n=1 Tax=Vreelandella massiliensis TaxID=1816686 RepID=UPI003BF5814A
MPLNVRTWDCSSCGTKAIDRDVNAAINIHQQGLFMLRAEGLSVLAHGGLRKPGHAPAAV